MKAMILAAGLGNRMRPLTDTTPKPLLEVDGKALIIYHIERLAAVGIKEIIINIAHLGFMIPDALGDGSKWNIKLIYSDEQTIGALESAGGIIKALPLLSETFIVINADVWCDYHVDTTFGLNDKLAHIILVNNPDHNPNGDFALNEDRIENEGTTKFTFSGIGYYHKDLFANLEIKKQALAPLLRDQIKKDRISGEVYEGTWRDIGTPERLEEINQLFKR